MEKPSTKKPMNVLKTMVFLENFMYLVVETITYEGEKFMHFINLKKDEVTKDMVYFLNHLDYFKGQKITKCYCSKDRLTNW